MDSFATLKSKGYKAFCDLYQENYKGRGKKAH